MKFGPVEQSVDARPPRSWQLAGLIPTGGPGMAASNDGPIEMIVMTFLGGFIGLLLGFMAAQVSRLLPMFAGVSIGRPS